MKKIITLFLAIVLLVTSLSLGAFAQIESSVGGSDSNIITPLWANGNAITTNFIILSDGAAYVSVDYIGIKNVTTKIRSEVYIQKRVLGFIWVKTDIGVSGNVWYDSDTENYIGSFLHSAQLSDSGTYRAVFEVTFSGTAGADDVLTTNIQAVY